MEGISLPHGRLKTLAALGNVFFIHVYKRFLNLFF